jgi:hypothetical protein
MNGWDIGNCKFMQNSLKKHELMSPLAELIHKWEVNIEMGSECVGSLDPCGSGCCEHGSCNCREYLAQLNTTCTEIFCYIYIYIYVLV